MKKNYKEFLESKLNKTQEIGFDINENDLNPLMFPFQKFIVKLALKKPSFNF